jgi:hypothetical protein
MGRISLVMDNDKTFGMSLNYQRTYPSPTTIHFSVTSFLRTKNTDFEGY